MTTLKGMTWNHARAIDPLIAVCEAWERETGVSISWDSRSLQDFESYPVEDLARAYDLIVIDHPHVGQITAKNCLVALPDAPEIAEGSVGGSAKSYLWDGRTWAWPIDAASQVQAERPDLGSGAQDWDEVTRLAREGRVMMPLRPPHGLMSFMTLAANLGAPCRSDGAGEFVDRQTGLEVLRLLKDVTDHLDPVCYEMDPIAVFEAVALSERISCVPLCYGYVNYAIEGFRPNRLRFRDIPSARTGGGVRGGTLGGTGIAVSAFGGHIEEAVRFARHLAGPDVQASTYARAGGQAGHRAAWTDPDVDAAAGGFYSGTMATLDASYIRPRHDGYMDFQGAASERINKALEDGDFEHALEDLQGQFDQSFR